MSQWSSCDVLSTTKSKASSKEARLQDSAHNIRSLPSTWESTKKPPRGISSRIFLLPLIPLLLFVAACLITQEFAATFGVAKFGVPGFSISPVYAIGSLFRNDYSDDRLHKISILSGSRISKYTQIDVTLRDSADTAASSPPVPSDPSPQSPSTQAHLKGSHPEPSPEAAAGNFTNGNVAERFYMIAGGGDYCTGESHWAWSFLCAAAEARLLNRTLVMRPSRCIPAQHSLTGRKEEKPMELYYNMKEMARRQLVVYETAFKRRFGSADPKQLAARGRMSVAEFKPFADALWVGARTQNVSLVVRRLREQQFTYQICAEEKNKAVLKRDYGLLSRPGALQKLSKEISASMAWDYDAVHVRRGDKVKPANRIYWPNLDRDTRPNALLKTLPKFIKPGRHVYIASNERKPGFFTPLSSLYHIHVLSDYRHLWAPGSVFHKHVKKLFHGLNLTTFKPEMDAHMEWVVESTVLTNAKKRVETFNDLTNDSKNAMIRHNAPNGS